MSRSQTTWTWLNLARNFHRFFFEWRLSAMMVKKTRGRCQERETVVWGKESSPLSWSEALGQLYVMCCCCCTKRSGGPLFSGGVVRWASVCTPTKHDKSLTHKPKCLPLLLSLFLQLQTLTCFLSEISNDKLFHTDFLCFTQHSTCRKNCEGRLRRNRLATNCPI